MTHKITLLAIVFGIMAAGCASLSKEECARANWDAIGYGDGSGGKPAGRFNTHQKACAEHGLAANFAQYKDGHQRGLREVFCKPRNGYHLGLRGAGYNNVCPTDIEQNFLDAYHYGRNIDKIHRSCNHLKQQIAWAETELDKLDTRIAKLKREKKNDDTANPDRHPQILRNQRREATALYDRIKRSRQKKHRLEIFKKHLRSELLSQSQRYEMGVTHIIQKSALLGSEQQMVRRIFQLSVEKGHLESRVNWTKSNPESTLQNRRHTAIVKRQIKDISSKIHHLKKGYTRNKLTNHQKRRLEHYYKQAEYRGTLQHHHQTLTGLYDPYVLNLLIDVHFDAEIENLNHRIDFARQNGPSKEALAIQRKRNQELREAQRQRNENVDRIKDMKQKMGQMQQEMDQLKSASRY